MTSKDQDMSQDFKHRVHDRDFIVNSIWEGTGDELHYNDIYARKTEFGGRVLSGLALTCLASAHHSAATKWSPPGRLDLSFDSVVLANDEIGIRQSGTPARNIDRCHGRRPAGAEDGLHARRERAPCAIHAEPGEQGQNPDRGRSGGLRLVALEFATESTAREARHRALAPGHLGGIGRHQSARSGATTAHVPGQSFELLEISPERTSR